MSRLACIPVLAVLLTVTGCAGLPNVETSDGRPAVTTAPEAAGSGSAAVDGVGGADGGLALVQAVEQLTVKPEARVAYSRSAFRHWNAGLVEGDGCDTRAELLIAEAVEKPTLGDGCKLTGGQWLSYYDEVTVTSAPGLDVDHMVPLEEAWSSGAHAWTAERREAYANDLDAPRSLVAVTAKTNRSKGKRDIAEWLPPATSALCTYLEDWTATKLRWNLTIDQTEHDALAARANNCPDSTITYKPAP
ncbi:HNH endonuclease family protein [Streptomyces sp. NPDC127119]|uniref:HNH endonuclease family protein n=1 Tax=Streptomyces sp. NPDC127119 TaxID=3345370 RepID=UPI00364478B7